MNQSGKVKILFVEDDCLQIKYISDILTNANFIIKNISNGKEAFDFITLRRNEFDVLLLDQNLPEMNGLEILEALQELNIEIPTVFLSTENNSQNIVKAIKLGAYDFVIKNTSLHNELPIIILNAKHHFELHEENKRLNKALKQNDEMFKCLFNNHSSVQFFIHPETGNFLLANESALTFFGESINQLYKKSILDYNINFINTINQSTTVSDNNFSFETTLLLNYKTHIFAHIDISRIYLSDTNYYHVTLVDLTDKNNIQKSLKESNEKYKILVERMNEGLMMVDNNDRIQFINNNGLKILGYKSDELIGKIGYETIVHSDDSKIVIQKNKERIEKKSDFYEIRLIKKDKTPIWVSMSGSPIFNDKGETIGSIGLFIDITEKKNVLESLQKSEEKNNALLEAMPDLIFVFDKDANFIDYSASESNSKKFLVSPDIFLGKNLKDVIPDLYSPTIKTLKVLFETGKPQKYEYQLFNNNEISYYESRLVLCGKDKALSIIRDITDAKINFINLDKERRILNHIVENVIGGYWDWNLKEDTEYFSPKFKSLLGYEDHELENHPRTWRKIVLQDDLEVVKKQTEIHFQSRGEIPFYSEIRYKHKNGSIIWVICSGFVIEWDENNNPIRMVGCHVDITERKKQELALLESEIRFKALHDASFGGIAIHDKGIILECNQGLSEMMGYSYQELIGMNGLMLISEKTRDIVLNNINSGYTKPYEAFGLRKNGEEFPMRLEARKIPFNGKMVRSVEFRDITLQKQTENDLLIAQKRLKEAMLMADLAKWEYDIEKNVFTFNDDFYKLYATNATLENGYEMSAMEYVKRFVYKDDILMIANVMEDANNSNINDDGNIKKLEHRIIRRDNIVRDIRVSYFSIYDEKGKKVKRFGANQDITEYNKTKIQLQEKLEQLELINENVPNIIWKTNIDENINFYDSYISETVDEFLGLPRNTINHSFSEYFKYIKNEYKSDIINIFKTAIANSGEKISFEYEVTKADGNKAWFISMGKVTIKNDNVFAFGTATDITERKKQELALLESEDKFKKVIEESADGFTISDSDGKIIDWNKKMEEITEYSKEEILNNYMWDVEKKLVGNNYEVEKLKIKSLSVLKNQTHLENIASIEGKIHTKSNKIKHVASSSFLINSNSNKFLVRIVRDITDKKRNEELLQKLEIAEKTTKFKQQFLANMSHEMRTPMNGIIGMTDFLLNTKLDSTQLDYAQTIKDSSETLLNLLNDILVLSKIEAGKLELNNINFEMADLINKSINLFKALVKHKNLNFSSNFDENIPRFINADKHKILQVISNLLNNAIKFTDSGKIELNIKLLTTYNNQCLIEVSVVDTGIGIPELNLEQIFDSFTQADNTNSRLHDGVGLGLTICKNLVDLLKGQINVQSKVGEGSKFWFTFIAEICDKKADMESLSTENITYTNRLQKKLSVLLVEDKKVNQKVVQLMLNKLNCEVDIIENGKDAIEHIDDLYLKTQNFKYNLILMDIQMPLMDGETAVKYLKSKYQNLPVIIGLSANAMEGDKEYYISIGMDDYLSKPVSLNDLESKLSKWFN